MKNISSQWPFCRHFTRALALVGCAALVGASALYGQIHEHAYGIPSTNESAAYHPIEVTADGGTITVGTTENASGNRDVYLIKTNTLGVVQWSYAYGSSASGSNEEGYDVFEDTDYLGNTTGYVVVGRVRDINGSDVFMLKVDPLGGYLWSYRYEDLDNNFELVGHAITKYGLNYVVAGTRYRPGVAGSSDALFLKTDLNGINASYLYTGVANVDDGAYDISMSSGGNATIVGFTMNGTRTDGLIFAIDLATGGLNNIPRRYGSSGNNDTLFSVQALGSHILTSGTIDYGNDFKDMWGLVVDAGSLGPIWGHGYSAYVSGPSINRINLGADMRYVGGYYMLLGTTAYAADNGVNTYTRQIVLSTLNTGTGLPLNAKAYGETTLYGKASQGYGVRGWQGLHVIGGQENFWPMGGPPGTGLFDVYLIRSRPTLTTGCEDNADIFTRTYTSNVFLEFPPREFLPIPVKPHGLKLGFSVDAYGLCCTSYPCKTLLEHTPAPSGDLSLEVHGDPASGDVHVAATGMKDGTTIDIFDASGRTVRSFEMASGAGEIVWDGADNGGNRLPSGLYFVRAQGATSVITRPAQLVR